MPGSISGVKAPPNSPELNAYQPNDVTRSGGTAAVTSSATPGGTAQLAMAGQNNRTQLKAALKQLTNPRNSVLFAPPDARVDADVPPIPMIPEGIAKTMIIEAQSISEEDDLSFYSALDHDFEDVTHTPLTGSSVGSEGQPLPKSPSGSSFAMSEFIGFYTSDDNNSSTGHQSGQVVPASGNSSAAQNAGMTGGASPQPSINVADSSGAQNAVSESSAMPPPQPAKSSGFQNFIHRFRINPRVTQPEISLPDIPFSKGFESCCANLADNGIRSDALQDIRNVIEGKALSTTATVLDQTIGTHGTLTNNSGVVYENIRGIRIVARELKNALEQNLPLPADDQQRDRAGKLVHRLIDLSCDPQSVNTYNAIAPELMLWAIAEQRLLDTGIPKKKIVEMREKFLTAMYHTQAKEENRKNIADKCIAPNEHLTQADKAIKSLNDLIKDYQSTVKGKKGAEADLPSDKEIKGLRTSIAKLVEDHKFAEVDIFAKGSDCYQEYNYLLTQTAPALVTKRNEIARNYEETKQEIKDAFKMQELNPWREAALATNYKILKGLPEDILKELKKTKLQTLTPPDQKTRLIDAAGQNGMSLSHTWMLDAALSEANRFNNQSGLTVKEAAKQQKLTYQDALKLREWTSDYLGNAIDHMRRTEG
jgi:hypothetical protein